MKVKKIYANTLDPIEYFLDKKVLFISAHPDDEIIGAGTLLTLLKEPSFLHTTDGAPKDKIDCIHAGYFDLKEYSNARRSEFRSALFLVIYNRTAAIILKSLIRKVSID